MLLCTVYNVQCTMYTVHHVSYILPGTSYVVHLTQRMPGHTNTSLLHVYFRSNRASGDIHFIGRRPWRKGARLLDIQVYLETKQQQQQRHPGNFPVFTSHNNVYNLVSFIFKTTLINVL